RDPKINLYDAVTQHIEAEQKASRRVAVAAYSPGSLDRLSHLLADHGLSRRRTVASMEDLEGLPRGVTGLAVLPLERGFTTGDFAFIAEQDILGDRLARPARARRRPEQFLTDLAAFSEGDFLVHVDHGIGKYDGLATLDVGGAPHDCLRLIYEGGDK